MSLPADKPPFWVDEVEPQIVFSLPVKSLVSLFGIYRAILSISILIMVFAFLYWLQPLLGLLWLLLVVFSFGMNFYHKKVRQKKQQANLDIQERTKKQVGATVIGSAVHVAGHPKLEREQAIVIALTESEIRFFDYSGVNLDNLPLQAIESLHTVVYDDERVPHIDAVDSTAQALQVVFKQVDKEFTVLFRGMKRVRPIDWYHRIQQAREQMR
ncbi:MAG: hypothetical protein Fur0043_08460 [Anaerolineales bacterium]